MKALATAAAALSLIISAAPAQAWVIGWSNPGADPGNFTWTQSPGGTGGVFAGSAPVLFTFFRYGPFHLPLELIERPLDFEVVVEALALEGNPASGAQQGGLRGSVAFKYTGQEALDFGSGKTLSTGQNLVEASDIHLSIFAGSQFAAVRYGWYRRPNGWSSEVLDLDGWLLHGSFRLGTPTPVPTATPGQSLEDFSAGLQPRFEVLYASAPEPGTWIFLIAGFGILGASLRRRLRWA